jgi:hypothetical protein
VEERWDFTEEVRQFDGSKRLSPRAGVGVTEKMKR